MEPVRRFGAELAGSGLRDAAIAHLARCYTDALTTGDTGAWERLYDALFAELAAAAVGADGPAIRPAMLDSVMRILEDDFGTARFGERALRRLRESQLRRRENVTSHAPASRSCPRRERGAR